MTIASHGRLTKLKSTSDSPSPPAASGLRLGSEHHFGGAASRALRCYDAVVERTQLSARLLRACAEQPDPGVSHRGGMRSARAKQRAAQYTDEPHPHVHVALKAMTAGWEYHLNIRKPMLWEWRKEFARHLCALGVPAKAHSQNGPPQYDEADWDI